VTFEDPNSLVKGKFEEYKKQLNCSVEYFCHTCNARDIEGILRLKVEPSGEKFTLRNIMLAGTMLSRVDWIFGLVLQTGKETIIRRNTYFSRIKKNYMDKTIIKFNLFLISTIITISLLCKLLYTENQGMGSNNSSNVEAYLTTNKW